MTFKEVLQVAVPVGLLIFGVYYLGEQVDKIMNYVQFKLFNEEE